MANDDYSLHRKKPGAQFAFRKFSGTRDEMLAKYANIPGSLRSQYTIQQGEKIYDQTAIEQMLEGDKG